MLRITRMNGASGGVTLQLDGKLLAAWVDELRDACRDHPADDARPLSLDLTRVTFVDAAGAELLADLVRGGTVVVACSNFVGELLRLSKP